MKRVNPGAQCLPPHRFHPIPIRRFTRAEPSLLPAQPPRLVSRSQPSFHLISLTLSTSLPSYSLGKGRGIDNKKERSIPNKEKTPPLYNNHNPRSTTARAFVLQLGSRTFIHPYLLPTYTTNIQTHVYEHLGSSHLTDRPPIYPFHPPIHPFAEPPPPVGFWPACAIVRLPTHDLSIQPAGKQGEHNTPFGACITIPRPPALVADKTLAHAEIASGRATTSPTAPGHTPHPPSPPTHLPVEHEEGLRPAIMATSIALDGIHELSDSHSHHARNHAPLQGRNRRELPSIQPSLPHPRARPKQRIRKTTMTTPARTFSFHILLLALFAAIIPSVSAVYINFDNCLEKPYRNANDPQRLQFVPKFVWAEFNTTAPSHTLNVTVYGNVTGQMSAGDYPAADSPKWSDPGDEFGKIYDNSTENNKLATLIADFKTLTWSAWGSGPLQFCNYTNSACPLAPVFPQEGLNLSNPESLRSFSLTRDFYSTYSFANWEGTMRIVSPESNNQTLGCVSATITPDLGSSLANALRYLPAAILALVAVATIFAATCSPWGTAEIFRWTSNYGRDEDLLRLVTPGFGDCLQYIQFIVLAGSLNLNYPGFFQPVVSQASWSLLLFNQSFVSQGNGSHSLVDGLYFANGTYGISRLGQYVGMSQDEDIWANMAVWLLVAIGIVVLLVQLGFLGRWLFGSITGDKETGLYDKNWPFSAGNIVRIVFNYFLLPIIALSLFQMVVAPRSPASVVATAVVLLIGVSGVAVWIFWLIFTTRPRAHLFDDLPTILTYGPLYNTYSDDAAPFAFIPVLLTTMRGIAIGAIQPSGIAQIIILAICEVILILTLHAFRPFQSNTSMNAYHTFFSVVRLVSTLLMVAFVPSLGVAESNKGWIGYIILFLHAIVLIFGFFMNSLQTIIEVAARLGGAGADQRGGLTTVFGKRQLAKRNHRQQRSSLGSNAAMLGPDEHKGSIQLMRNSHARSISNSSAVLLNAPYSGSQRQSVGFESFTQGGEASPSTPGTGATPFNFLASSTHSSRRPTINAALDTADPYYRPPRPRKHTLDSMNAGPSLRGSKGSADMTNAPYADNPDQAESGDVGEGPSSWSPNRSITPAFLRMQREDSDPNLERRNQTDYSVRESDFYYGLRGPALSSQPTRKLKTGPADPMGPVSSATGWFKSLGMFAGKKKEKGKGFEVVRSTRMPPDMMIAEEEEDSSHMHNEPYQDSPGRSKNAETSPSGTKKPVDRDSPNRNGSGAAAGLLRRSSHSSSDASDDEDGYVNVHRVSDMAPSLGPIETGGGIELPSRIGSRVSRVSRGPSVDTRAGAQERIPTIPRKSSRRTSSVDVDQAVRSSSNRLSKVMSPSSSTRRQQHLHPNTGNVPIRLPFGSTDPSPSPDRTPIHSASSSIYPTDDFHVLGGDELAPPPTIVPAVSQERPLSTGYVHQHTAGDSIHNEPFPEGNRLEASAEFVDRSRSVSTAGTAMSYRSSDRRR
ncbi:unnamed protein product [Periconia digitata]|uniref:ML-like domain-containing protein n=1 Tax=Periconia digitata TaxID=1303443 RepID=A0A9W4XN02_9PLEO|nr:unnamed protein product [Periconia digitata]